MPSSTVRRERLVSPLNLICVGLLFAVAFYMLLPDKQLFNLSGGSADNAVGVAGTGDADTNVIPDVDVLDLAYLKARTANGDMSAAEVSATLQSLVQSQQIDSARALIAVSPGLQVDEQTNFLIEVEVAAARVRNADPENSSPARAELANKLRTALTAPALQNRVVLKRASQISTLSEDHQTRASLFRALADVDSANASSWLTQCGDVLAAIELHQKAAQCFADALQHTNNSDEQFDLKLGYFRQVALQGNLAQADSAVKPLLQHEPVSIDQRQALATVLLENGKPELAHPVYEKLAITDIARQPHWYQQAATWAEAANDPSQAANYIAQSVLLTSGQQRVQAEQKLEALLVASGDKEKAFAQMKKRIDRDADDVQQLRNGVELALQYGKTDQATVWNQRILDLYPMDDAAVLTQIDLGLATRDLDDAKVWANYGISVTPQNRELRKRYAQLLEWTGDPIAAQEQWQWLALNEPGQQSFAQVLRLAEMNRQSADAANAIESMLRYRQPTNDDVRQLVKFYELEGNPLGGAATLEQLIKDHGKNAFVQQELASLYKRNLYYQKALAAWEQYASDYGRSSLETLNRMEMHWHANEPEKSLAVAQSLLATGLESDTTPFQIHLISELAWRYRDHKLALLVTPHVENVKNKEEAVRLGHRIVQSMVDAGDDKAAIEQATQNWKNTGSSNAALTAMSLAYKINDEPVAAYFIENSPQHESLHELPAYWNTMASLQIRAGKPADAEATYRRALLLDAGNDAALVGLLWMYIDNNDTAGIESFLADHRRAAESQPALWTPFAIANLQIGKPADSLTWFAKLHDRMDSDYNLLLTYGEALESAGHAEHAYKVRLYTLERLRPLLAQSTQQDQSLLIRQYARLLSLYGGTEHNERLVQALLNTDSDDTEDYNFWREDIAISWLMSTQRHEHARMVMTKIHNQRLQAPAWQELAYAMHGKDRRAIQQILANSGNTLSLSDSVLALRMLGQEQQAFSLAEANLRIAATAAARSQAMEQYVSMRADKPRYTGATMQQTSLSALSIRQAGASFKHTLANSSIVVGVDVARRNYTSNRMQLDGMDSESDVAVSMNFGNRLFGGVLTAGVLATDQTSTPYANTRFHVGDLAGRRELTTELAYNEPATESAELRVAAKQNRASVGVESALRKYEFIKLQADVNEISTRVEKNRVARGLNARVEYGVRGSIGSNNWSTSVAANRANKRREAELPDELKLDNSSTVDTVLAASYTTLSVGASLSRGGINTDYPQVSTPRYFLNASVGHSWPNNTIGMQLDAGAGMRVLGGDELSIGLSHDTQPGNALGSINDATTFGVNYRFHF